MGDHGYYDENWNEGDPLRSGPDYLRRRAQRLWEAAEREQARLDALEAHYQQYGPEPADGRVVTFTKQHAPGGPRYAYAALRKKGRWFLTQSGSRPGGAIPSKTWHELIDYAGGAEITVLIGPDQTEALLAKLRAQAREETVGSNRLAQEYARGFAAGQARAVQQATQGQSAEFPQPESKLSPEQQRLVDLLGRPAKEQS